tara:strand:+ start:431 stop:643 length:213 start_codon:yes stop_codon:yes gene_type:complete
VVAVEQVGQEDLLQCLADLKVMEALAELEVQEQVILQRVEMVPLIEVEVVVAVVILDLHLQLLEEMAVAE